jgi:hypothetical protein
LLRKERDKNVLLVEANLHEAYLQTFVAVNGARPNIHTYSNPFSNSTEYLGYFCNLKNCPKKTVAQISRQIIGRQNGRTKMLEDQTLADKISPGGQNCWQTKCQQTKCLSVSTFFLLYLSLSLSLYLSLSLSLCL